MAISASQFNHMSTDTLQRKYKQVQDRSTRATTMETALADLAVMQVIADILSDRKAPIPE